METRAVGMDQPHYRFYPLPQRPRLVWPRGERVALCVIVSLEHFDWIPPADAYGVATTGTPFRSPFPNVRTYSHYEYGPRVGIFRVMDVLARLGVPATLAIDAASALRYSLVVERAQAQGWELIAHGQAVTRMITSRMSEADEARYVETSLQAIEEASGKRPLGWLGPEYGESTRTPAVLARLGVRYVCDWPNDEQPYPMTVPIGELVSLPILLDLDDVVSHYVRHVSIMRYGQLLKDAFDGLYQDGATQGRLLALNVHPWLIGQPFRVKYFEDALRYVVAHEGVWKATGREIVDWYRGQLA